jgi:uncharacterized protein DUF3467
MSSKTGDIMVRLESLERSNRRWRFLGVTALAALAIVLVVNGIALSQRVIQPKNERVEKAADALDWNVDKSQASVVYVNFCQAGGTPEELILDFGLNPSLLPNPKEPVKITHRIVMNFYTAKRLESLLHQTVQQHENAFGPLELDFNKRMLPAK